MKEIFDSEVTRSTISHFKDHNFMLFSPLLLTGNYPRNLQENKYFLEEKIYRIDDMAELQFCNISISAFDLFNTF